MGCVIAYMCYVSQVMWTVLGWLLVVVGRVKPVSYLVLHCVSVVLCCAVKYSACHVLWVVGKHMGCFVLAWVGLYVAGRAIT